MENILKKVVRTTEVVSVDVDGIVVDKRTTTRDEYYCTICKVFFGQEFGPDDYTSGQVEANHHVIEKHFDDKDFVLINTVSLSGVLTIGVACKHCPEQFTDFELELIIKHKIIHANFDVVLDVKTSGTLTCKQCGYIIESIAEELFFGMMVHKGKFFDKGFQHVHKHKNDVILESRCQLFLILCKKFQLDIDSASVITQYTYPIIEYESDFFTL